MKTLGVGLSLVAFAIPSFSALGAPGGELDATFGQNGRLIMNDHRSGGAVVQQPDDGKLVIAGSTVGDADQSVFVVLRLNTDGSLDDTFGNQGVAAIDFGDGSSFATALALQADGRIVVAGQAQPGTGGSNELAIARLNPDGTLDASFDGNGRVTVGVAGLPLDVALASDGGIVLAGKLDDAIALVHLTADGSPDIGFGIDPVPGTRLVQIGDLIESSGWGAVGLARQDDGAYIVCGADYSDSGYYYWYYGATGDMKAIRLLADGSLDPGFGANGVWQLEDNYSIYSVANACFASADGSILLTGYRDGRPILVKLRPEGMTDTAVWTSGTVQLDRFGDAHSLVMLADGDLALIVTIVGGPVSSLYVARIDSVTGMLDPAFGDNGMASVNFGQGDLQSYVAPYYLFEQTAGRLDLLEQTDGKLVAMTTVRKYAMAIDGSSDETSALAVARVDPNGAGNNGFVGFSGAASFVSESEVSFEVAIPVYRTGGSIGPFLVDYETRADSATSFDFLSTAGTLVWPDGDTASKLINVRIAADAVAEPTESFNVALLNPTGALAQDLTSVVIYDTPEQPVAPGYPKGGGGAFGVELILLFLCSQSKRLLIAVRKLRRLRTSRHIRLLASLALVTAGGTAQSQTDTREESWDLGMALVDAGDASVSGPAGTSIRMKANTGWALWASYNLTDRLAIGLEWSQLSPDVETRYVEDRGELGLGPIAMIREKADIENIHLKGTLNFLKRKITPFAEVGLGWTKLDSNVDIAQAAGLDTLWVDWYDPWWGYVWHPDAVPGRYQGTNTSVIYALGVRWDVSTRFTARASFGGIAGHQVSSVTGSAEPDLLRLEFGWRF